jgi:hypothetical protein
LGLVGVFSRPIVTPAPIACRSSASWPSDGREASEPGAHDRPYQDRPAHTVWAWAPAVVKLVDLAADGDVVNRGYLTYGLVGLVIAGASGGAV